MAPRFRRRQRRLFPLIVSAIVIAIVFTIQRLPGGGFGLPLVASAAAEDGGLAGQASVIDGDTIEIHGRRIRLVGIDAVESGQRCSRGGKDWNCSRDAAFALADRIGQATVTCEGSETDRYGRLLAVCRAGGEDLNRWMVEQGWAVAYRRYSMAYVDAEDEARAAGRGLWAGRFEMPWDWRHARQGNQ